MSLLKSYIDETIKHYQEPERRGVQKGKEIGPFRGRFEAALYSMYKYEKKEIAEISKITYPFMRKLWVDDNFIKLREVLIDQFVISYLFFYLESGVITKVGKTTRDLYPLSIELAFGDADTYSLDLKIRIFNFLLDFMKEDKYFMWVESPERLIYLLSRWNEPELNKKLFLSVLSQFTEIIPKILSSDQVSKEHQIKLIECTRFINKLSNTI